MSYDPQPKIKAKSLRSDTIKNLVRNVVFPGKIFKDATNEHKSVQIAHISAQKEHTKDTKDVPQAPKDVKSGAVSTITRKFSQVNSVLFQKKKTMAAVVVEEIPLRKIAADSTSSKPHSFDIDDIPMPGDSKMAVSFEEHSSVGHVKSVSTPHTTSHSISQSHSQATKPIVLESKPSRIQSIQQHHQPHDLQGTYRENTNCDLYGRVDTSLVDELDDEEDNDELEKTNNSLLPSSNTHQNPPNQPLNHTNHGNLQVQQQQRKQQLQKNSYNCKSFDMRTKNAKELLSRLCPKNPPHVKGISSIHMNKQLLVGKRQSLSRVHSNANNGAPEFHRVTDLKTNTTVSNIPAHKCSRSAVSWAFAESKINQNHGKREQNLREDASPRFQVAAYVSASPNHGPSVKNTGLKTARDLDSSTVENAKIIVSDFVTNTMTSVPKKNLTKNIKDLKNAATFSKLSSKIYDHEKFIDEALMKDETLIKLQAESLADYDLGELIGRGSYATVRLGQHRLSKMRVAIKQYDKFKLLDPLKRNNVLNEIMNLARISHKNVVRLVNWIFSPHQVCIVMDYGGMNFELFLRNNQQKLPKQQAKSIAYQIADALRYCHDNGVVHRDLKADNILIDEQNGNKITVIDFGFSSFVESSTRCTVFCGTPNYMAPEVVRKTPYDGMAADMWAFGVVLYRILTGNFPFQHPSEKELYGLILTSQYQLPADLGPQAVDLLKKLLNSRPSERLTSTQVCEHPWFTSID